MYTKIHGNRHAENHYNLLKAAFRKMIIEEGSFGTFVQKVNPITGRMGWDLEDENYDYQQEIARSMYADMLHDYDRNKKYYAALKKAIDLKHSKGQKAHVLDIGTGTGLLSMMAAQCGADSIVACEGFPPIAEIAKSIISDNSLSQHVEVVSKRSTDLKVGPGLDLERRANILVTEVFDTELIGEGAVETFNHANEHLLEENSIIVPWTSDVYAVLMDSKMLSSFNRIKPDFLVDGDTAVALPPEMVNCSGNAGVHDLQVSQVPVDRMKLLSKPLKIFKFDFFKRITSNESTLSLFQALDEGEGNVVCVYWTLDMDQDGETVVSCAPSFIEPTPWRDHWMQAVYHLKNPTQVAKGDDVELVSKHDQYSMWFDVHKAEDPYNIESLQMPACTCGLHGIASRTRLFAMNDSRRWMKYMKFLKGIKKNSNILYVGDTSLLPIAAAKMGAKKVFCVEESGLPHSVMDQMIKHNEMSDTVVLLKKHGKELITSQIDVVIGEPYFRDSSYPWDGIRLWYIASELAPNAAIHPRKMKILGVPMEFEHLHKIRAPLQRVEGFNVSSFDELIESASQRTDSEVDVQPMFEYPGKCLSPPVCLFEVTLQGEPPEKSLKSSGEFTIESGGALHGVVLWAEWTLGGEVISTGLEDGDKAWDMGSRQGVYFIKESCNVAPQETVTFDVSFSPQGGTFSFDFKPQQAQVTCEIANLTATFSSAHQCSQVTVVHNTTVQSHQIPASNSSTFTQEFYDFYVDGFTPWSVHFVFTLLFLMTLVVTTH